jgi:biopolymer transport protein ExbD
MDTVSLNGQPEAEMSELLRALGTQEPLAKLYDDLVALKNIYRLVHPQPRSWQATILIEADKNLSFGVLRKVSSTCAAAGYGNVQFVVEQKA